MRTDWPKDITEWHDGSTGYLSIPFTWLLPKVRRRILQPEMFTSRLIVGGPAVRLMPEFFAGLPNVVIRRNMFGVLQRVNPDATRTTEGCVRRCKFCGVQRIEGDFRELSDWPDRPVLCDNNLLAASDPHFNRVIDRLIPHGWADFNQGLDARLLTTHHATRIAEIKKPIARLALDNDRDRDIWQDAVERFRTAGIAKSRIRSYVLCGFDGSPEQDRERCRFVESFGLKALPMWFHELDALTFNAVTDKQQVMGWTNRKRRELMTWYYFHRTLAVRG